MNTAQAVHSSEGPDRFWAETHQPDNLGSELADYSMYLQDQALVEAVHREGAAWADGALQAFGAMTGSARYLELGVQANQHPPELDTHDRFGRRVDLVRFHPAYHELMQTAIGHGLHASAWTHPRPGAHVARAAHFYLQSQVEAGHGCPITMTFACVP
ncbi:MAG: DNA alkylation response protein, partial [Betaproteobacteria bacterium]|nr:DNA alkylation response protein [Betaproteobacteria bacterium]